MDTNWVKSNLMQLMNRNQYSQCLSWSCSVPQQSATVVLKPLELQLIVESCYCFGHDFSAFSRSQGQWQSHRGNTCDTACACSLTLFDEWGHSFSRVPTLPHPFLLLCYSFIHFLTSRFSTILPVQGDGYLEWGWLLVGRAHTQVAGRLSGVLATWVWCQQFHPLVPKHQTSICDIDIEIIM